LNGGDLMNLDKLKELDQRIEGASYDDDQELHYDLIQEALDFDDHYRTALVISSWRGQDLNAAREIFDILLPGTNQISMRSDVLFVDVEIMWWPRGVAGVPGFSSEGKANSGEYALAWLQAVIRTRIKAMEAGFAP
jgi:hypothetical protein